MSYSDEFASIASSCPQPSRRELLQLAVNTTRGALALSMIPGSRITSAPEQETEASTEYPGLENLFGLHDFRINPSVYTGEIESAIPVLGVEIDLTKVLDQNVAKNGRHNGIPIRFIGLDFGVVDDTTLWDLDVSVPMGYAFLPIRSDQSSGFTNLRFEEFLYMQQMQRQSLQETMVENSEDPSIVVTIPVINEGIDNDLLRKIVSLYGGSYIVNSTQTPLSRGIALQASILCGERIIYTEGGHLFEKENSFKISRSTPVVGKTLEYISKPYKPHHSRFPTQRT